MVPQDSLLFDGTVQANVSLTKPEQPLKSCRSSEIACADEFIETLPSGYSSSVGEGSAYQVAKGKASYCPHDIKKSKLILDEATSALDVDTEKRLIRNIIDAYTEKTVLFITHRIASMVHADKIQANASK